MQLTTIFKFVAKKVTKSSFIPLPPFLTAAFIHSPFLNVPDLHISLTSMEVWCALCSIWLLGAEVDATACLGGEVKF